MSSISFLYNREIGGKYRAEFRNSNSLNLDHVFSRLVCHTKDVFTVHGEETDVPPFAAKFRRDASSDLLAVANEDGDITLYDSRKGYPECKLKSFVAHQNAIFDISWMPDKCQLITGSGDHTAALWHMACCKRISIFTKHTSSVKSIDICREQSAIFATGSRDGSINIWDTRDEASCIYSKPAVTINFAHCRRIPYPVPKRQKDSTSSVSAVVFQDSNHLASGGVADGNIKIWDLRRTYVTNVKYFPSPKYIMNYSDSGSFGQGCTSLVFDSNYRTLYGCITNNKIMKFNCHSYVKEADVYEGFRCTTYFIKLALSTDDQYLLSGSSDDMAYIWKTSRPGLPIVKLGVHSAEVTSVCWSPYDNTKLVTCGDDNKIAIWKIAAAEFPEKGEGIHVVSEPYSTGPKNENLPVQVNVQSSTTVSNIRVRRSPVILNQTPNKPTVRSITSFFSPITSTSSSSPIISTENVITETVNNSPSPSNKFLNKSPQYESSSQVLTPCNHFHKNNSSHSNQCSEGNTLSSPEIINSSLESKNSSSFLSPSLSVQNKENSNKHISPEIIYKKNNIGQTKRKVSSKHSTPSLKRKQTESSKKTKGHVKQEKKTTPEKTIMNYFSVALSPNN